MVASILPLLCSKVVEILVGPLCSSHLHAIRYWPQGEKRETSDAILPRCVPLPDRGNYACLVPGFAIRSLIFREPAGTDEIDEQAHRWL